ncbi:MAG: hypothetical protein OXF31_01265, partial [Gammaproteobacteria bacterium]|nr:hypothetical protein [Gammaproteobacteria bacterium]
GYHPAIVIGIQITFRGDLTTTGKRTVTFPENDGHGRDYLGGRHGRLGADSAAAVDWHDDRDAWL